MQFGAGGKMLSSSATVWSQGKNGRREIHRGGAELDGLCELRNRGMRGVMRVGSTDEDEGMIDGLGEDMEE